MIADILTVASKEFGEIFSFGDARGRSKLSFVVMIIIFGIVIPLQNGRAWVRSPVTALVWGWMPFLWVSGVVADLFAGERERHTLESLLATRLSDQSILFGKLLAALAYGFTLSWVIMIVSLVTINVAYGRNGLLFYPLPILLGALIFSILISGLAASIGVLVSLRAGSVRQAQQMMSVGMLLLFVPFMLIQFVPRRLLVTIGIALQNSNPVQIAIGVVLFLVVLELILIAIARRLFQRSKLILD
jgi:ABC-2 type transport system permease protein